MANYTIDYYTKNYSIYKTYIDDNSISCNNDNPSKDCINKELSINIESMDKLQSQLYGYSSSNENYENKNIILYNEYMTTLNMTIGIIGLVYYVYFFIKTNKSND
jgi:hypothetical protein